MALAKTRHCMNNPTDKLICETALAQTKACGKISGQVTNYINIYDLENGEWSLDSFPVPRNGMNARTIGDRVFFVGGYADGVSYSSRVDIYDNATDTWTTTDLSQ